MPLITRTATKPSPDVGLILEDKARLVCSCSQDGTTCKHAFLLAIAEHPTIFTMSTDEPEMLEKMPARRGMHSQEKLAAHRQPI